MANSNSYSGDMVCQDDVMMLLRPFCADVTVAVKPRLDVLLVLEKVSQRKSASNERINFNEKPVLIKRWRSVKKDGFSTMKIGGKIY